MEHGRDEQEVSPELDRGVGNVADSACNRVGLELAIDGVCRIEKLTAGAGGPPLSFFAFPSGCEDTQGSE